MGRVDGRGAVRALGCELGESGDRERERLRVGGMPVELVQLDSGYDIQRALYIRYGEAKSVILVERLFNKDGGRTNCGLCQA